MKFCPHCDRQFPDAAEKCEDDGNRLLKVHEPGKEQADALIGKELDGRYIIEAPIGRGGMGAVFRATQSAVGRTVAIKVLNSEVAQEMSAVKRFMQEARAASALSHPNTITIHDFGQTPDGLLYLVMELIKGETLAQLIKREGPLGTSRSARITLQILNALNEAHHAGIIHRDLKPENVLISARSGNPDFAKVLDFGLAKLVGSSGTDQNLTRTGQIFGTPGYMAPEQGRGIECDDRADIYATGVMLFEMLSGQRPFQGDNPLSVLVKHMQQPPPEFSELEPPVVVDPLMAEVVRVALSKASADRFSATQMHDAIVEALTASGSNSGLVTHSALVQQHPIRPAGGAVSDPALTPTLGSGIMGQVSVQSIPPAAKSRFSPVMAVALLIGLGGGGFGVYHATRPAPTPVPPAARAPVAVAPAPDAAPPVVVNAARPQPDASAPPAPDAAVVAVVKMATLKLTANRKRAKVSVYVDGALTEQGTTPLTVQVALGAQIKAVFRHGKRTKTKILAAAAEGSALRAVFEKARPHHVVKKTPKAKPKDPVPTPPVPAGGVDDLK